VKSIRIILDLVISLFVINRVL